MGDLFRRRLSTAQQVAHVELPPPTENENIIDLTSSPTTTNANIESNEERRGSFVGRSVLKHFKSNALTKKKRPFSGVVCEEFLSREKRISR
jgi:hypothetical protein